MSLRWTWSERNLTSASWSWKLRSPANARAKWTCQSSGRIKALCRAWVSKLYRAVKWVLQRSIMIWVINVLVEDHLRILSHAIHTSKHHTNVKADSIYLFCRRKNLFVWTKWFSLFAKMLTLREKMPTKHKA